MKWLSAFAMVFAFAGFLTVLSVAVFHWGSQFHPWYWYLPHMAICLALIVPNYMMYRIWRDR